MVHDSDRCERCEELFTAGEVRRYRDECGFDEDGTPSYCDDCLDAMHVSTGDDVKDAMRAIERVHRRPKGSTSDEARAVARAIGVPRRRVTDELVDQLFEYGQHGPSPEAYATAMVGALREVA